MSNISEQTCTFSIHEYTCDAHRATESYNSHLFRYNTVQVRAHILKICTQQF